ncbi:LysE family transporter [Yersinia enterocolitica]|nr:LysE family transporter [Yersinia enterocolitica]
MRWLLSLLGPSMGLASTRSLQAAFKSVPDRFVTRITYRCKLIGTHSLAAFLQLELFRVYTLRSGSCGGVSYAYSPESLTDVSSSGFVRLLPTRNSNSFGYSLKKTKRSNSMCSDNWQRFFLLIRGNAQLNQLHHRNRFRCWHWIGCRTQNGFTDPSIVSRIITR